MEKQELIEHLIDDICNYIEYLEGEPFRYSITLHKAENLLGMYFYRFLKYNYHSCQVCNEMKHSSTAWQHCILRQGKIAAASSGRAILGTCYAGVSEYVFPLYTASGKQCDGFLCFSGFCIDPADSLERACAAARRFRLSREKLVRAVNSLNKDIPDGRTLSVQAAPLQNMFTLLFHLLNPEQIDATANSPETLYLNMLSLTNFMYRDPDFSLKTLADSMNLNYSYVSHIFARYGKSTFPRHLRSLRIETAKKYLEYTDDSISLIASRCGFNDSNYFSHIFFAETGVTPTQWRRRYIAET